MENVNPSFREHNLTELTRYFSLGEYRIILGKRLNCRVVLNKKFELHLFPHSTVLYYRNNFVCVCV